MSLKIPITLKKEFKDGFDEYIKSMGRQVLAYLKPHEVQCPNCIFDAYSNKSSNLWNSLFLKPVNIFPGTTHQQIIYPVPFNVTTVSGIQYDPSIPNPKILNAVLCPVCKGLGILTIENTVCFRAVITVGKPQTGAQPSDFTDLSAGRDGMQLTRIKTYANNYSVCRDAESFLIDGVQYKTEIPVRLKGLGNKSIVEVYLSTVNVDSSSDNQYDTDNRLKIVDFGQVSNQASPATPTIPPIVPGDDVW